MGATFHAPTLPPASSERFEDLAENLIPSLTMMLLEREKELDLLNGLFDELPTSGGKIVLIRGEAGIGKTSLVNSFIDGVRDIATIRVGFCDDLETPRPLGPLWDIALDESYLLEALRDSDRRRVMQETLEILSRTLRPNIVVIEDTHWSDGATLDTIKFVGRRIARTNGLLVLTYRNEEVDLENPLRAVLGALPADDVSRLDLGALTREGVAQIVTGSGWDADVVFEATHGNPFLATEMALTSENLVPASVRDSVMARVGRLSILAREMLFHLSVIPERTTISEVARLMGGAGSQLAECERMGLLDIDGDSVTFRHELIRRAVESSLATTEKTEIHEALLANLPDTTDPARLVYHANGAGDVERLLEVVPHAAAAAAEVGGHREAAAHYRALDPHLARLPVGSRAQLLFDWARIEYYMAEVVSVDLIDRAIELYREMESPELLARALTFAISVKESHARIGEAEEHALEAIEILDAEKATVDLALALSRHADLLIHQGQGIRADEVSDRAIAIGQEVGDNESQIRALTVKGMLAHVRGQPGGLQMIEQARKRAAEDGYRFEEVMALRGAAYTAQEINELDIQSDFAQRARDTAIRYEFPLLEAEANAVVADALMRSGKWREADDLASENLGSHVNADVHFTRILGLLRTRAGRSGAEPYLHESWALAEASTEIDYLLHAAVGLVEEMWLTGQLDTKLLSDFDELVIRGIKYEFPWLAGWLAFWLWKVGELTNAPAGTPDPHRMAMEGSIGAAAEFWESRNMPYEKAITLHSGNTEQRLIALEIVEDLGADAVAAKLRQELRTAGVNVPRGKGKATRGHAVGLTARQAEVLALLFDGLSNSDIADRLFLSPRTVENHVSAVLAKLESTTREEAVARAIEIGIAQQK